MKKRNDDINKDLNSLKYIKDNIIIYFKDSYQNTITKIIEVINNNQNKKIIEYKEGRIKDLIKETDNIKELADKINEVKNLLIFNVIYDEMDSVKEENIKFENAYETLNEIRKYLHNNTNIIELNNRYKDIFIKVKEKLSNIESKINDFIIKLKKYFKITNTNLIDELTILFKSQKYESDINSIIFFFENYFEKDNKDWNEKMPSIDYKKNGKKTSKI